MSLGRQAQYGDTGTATGPRSAVERWSLGLLTGHSAGRPLPGGPELRPGILAPVRPGQSPDSASGTTLTACPSGWAAARPVTAKCQHGSHGRAATLSDQRPFPESVTPPTGHYAYLPCPCRPWQNVKRGEPYRRCGRPQATVNSPVPSDLMPSPAIEMRPLVRAVPGPVGSSGLIAPRPGIGNRVACGSGRPSTGQAADTFVAVQACRYRHRSDRKLRRAQACPRAESQGFPDGTGPSWSGSGFMRSVGSARYRGC